MEKPKLNWVSKPFADLTNVELYKVLQLRCEVFIIEQHCNYQDVDGKDLKSHHLMAWDGDQLVAYTRLLPAGLSFDEASIGRVLTSPHYRAIGAGKDLMTNSINEVYKLFGPQPIKIGAQRYLKRFYESFGFVKCSDEYLEDDIPHIEMIKN